MKAFAVVVLVAAACGGHARHAAPSTAPARPATVADRALGMLPDGAQIVVEVDLARLRANTVVGDVATRALADAGADAKLPALPIAVQGSPIANADLVVLAAYGVGTSQAATITILATKTDVPGASRISPELVALGPDEWLGQVEARAAIAAGSPITAPESLLRLREHAMPAGAPGAVLRITAQLGFDARVALARQTGIELAPAELSVWADVVDDFAMIVDADAADPGDRTNKSAVKRMKAGLETVLAIAAAEPAVRLLGISASLNEARFVEQGTWVRAIVAIGPRHLQRVVERARAMIGSPPASTATP